jgi:hypothetical protein
MAVAKVRVGLVGRRKNMESSFCGLLILRDRDLPIQAVRFVIGCSGRLNTLTSGNIVGGQ